MTASGSPGPALVLERVASLRARLWDCGFRPVAIYNADSRCTTSPGKAPWGDEWQLRARQTPPEAAFARVEPDAWNTGVLCDGLRVLDADVEDPDAIAQLRGLAFTHLGEAPTRYRENSPRFLTPYRAAEGQPRKRFIAGRLGKVEILGFGQQFVAFGKHPSGAPLRWRPESLAQTPRGALPAVTEFQVGQFLAAAMPIIGATREKNESATVRPEDSAELQEVLRLLINSGAEQITTHDDLPSELQAKLAAALAASDRLRGRWAAEVEDLLAAGHDASRSGRDFSLAALLKRAGFVPADAAMCLLAFDHGSANDEAKHPDARTRLRYVARSALRASAAPQRSEAERELCRVALALLRDGVDEWDVLQHIREVNAASATPLARDNVTGIALWAARTVGADRAA